MIRLIIHPRTSEEYNIKNIQVALRKIEKGLLSVKEAKLSDKFERLHEENVGMWEELYPEYIRVVNKINKK